MTLRSTLGACASESVSDCSAESWLRIGGGQDRVVCISVNSECLIKLVEELKEARRRMHWVVLFAQRRARNHSEACRCAAETSEGCVVWREEGNAREVL
jgi:hypothetical protein